MRYYSTRDREKKHLYSLREAAFMGLAPDGGLFMPESIPQIDVDKLLDLSDGGFVPVAQYVAGLLFGDEIEKEKLYAAVADALNFPVPLVEIGNGVYTLELFHGPTYAFKDVGARFMGRMMSLLREGDERLTILTATSGDTGSAVAGGFYGVEGIDVVVLYPEGKVSDLQERQMTTLGENIHPLRVRGDFDDCQRVVKEIFAHDEFRGSYNVTSANSINILRWLPQSFYYFYAWCVWYKNVVVKNPMVVTPSGNYGNIASGMLARKMGLPIKGFVAASNANDIIPHYLSTGEYRPGHSRQTSANAMDVGSPSNYERILCLYDYDEGVLREDVKGYSCSDEQIKDAIREIYEMYSYVSDPHSAVGYLAAKEYDVRGFYLSTAHCAKFSDVINDVLGFDVEIPAGLAKFLDKEKVFTPIDATRDAVEDFVIELNKK